jgi:O-antigen ligase
LATPSPGAALLAAVTPLVLFHVDYQPGVSFGSGTADVDVLLSDVLLALLAVAVAVRLVRDGAGVLRPGLPLWVLSAAFLGDVDYAFAEHAVTAAKYAEYAVVALAVPVLARRQDERELLLAVVAGWGTLAALVGLAQFAGVDVFDAWAAGRRQPSFLGHHDFAVLSGATFAAGAGALVFQRHKVAAATACAAGALGLLLSGSVAGLLGVVAVLAVATLLAVRRRQGLRTVAAIGAGVAVTGLALVAFRGNDLDDFLRFAGVLSAREEESPAGVETYSHRTLLAYLGLRLWADHPVAGAGWQASGEYDRIEPYVADAHERFSDVPEEAFPTPGRRYGVQNAYVQALADLGMVGGLLLVALLGTGVVLGTRSALKGSWVAAAAVGIVLVVGAVLSAQGLVAALAQDTLMWLGLGLVAAEEAA